MNIRNIPRTNIKRQIGTEKNTTPLHWLHSKPSISKLAFSRIAIVLTILSWIIYILDIIIRQIVEGQKNYDFTLEAFGYTLIVTFLTFSALMYLISRMGALERFSKHNRIPHSVLEKYFTKHADSTITVLVPSLAEEPEVIRKTMLSAALQEYPNIRVVLIFDDNPYPTDPETLNKLNESRKIPEQIQNLLSNPFKRLSKARNRFTTDLRKNRKVTLEMINILADEYLSASQFLRKTAQAENIKDHVDIFFQEQVLLSLANDLELVYKALRQAVKEKTTLTKDRMEQLYNRLVWIFQAELTLFERKKYQSLSHEPNKAMNLNSYIGLMGHKYLIEKTPDGETLVKVEKSKGKYHLDIPNSDFILTLDADSILLKDYCLRLVYFMEKQNDEKVAVVQTPYCSFRGASTRIERIAGATTDIQHILHQGLTQFGATFWVGANAIIRKKALEDIEEREWIDGIEIKRYIQDRTVIEDTESSIDLAVHGWTLANYPERLSYSATPPDFGSLIIQRRRWANGGLLILPKLWNVIRERNKKGEVVSWLEILLRINYMASITWASFGLVFLLVYPFNGNLLSPLVTLTALPYFISMGADLKYNRYKVTDIFNIYGLNLVLLPVNLAGVLKSIEQALTGRKIPFARTPKVKNRTVSSVQYILIPIGIIIFSAYTFVVNYEQGNWGNAFFAGLNTVATTWAIISYIGIGSIISDLWTGYISWLFVDKNIKHTTNNEKDTNQIDWKAILYHGEKSGSVPHHSLKNLINK